LDPLNTTNYILWSNKISNYIFINACPYLRGSTMCDDLSLRWTFQYWTFRGESFGSHWRSIVNRKLVAFWFFPFFAMLSIDLNFIVLFWLSHSSNIQVHTCNCECEYLSPCFSLSKKRIVFFYLFMCQLTYFT
jgi:hypothetical protein